MKSDLMYRFSLHLFKAMYHYLMTKDDIVNHKEPQGASGSCLIHAGTVPSR